MMQDSYGLFSKQPGNAPMSLEHIFHNASQGSKLGERFGRVPPPVAIQQQQQQPHRELKPSVQLAPKRQIVMQQQRQDRANALQQRRQPKVVKQPARAGFQFLGGQGQRSVSRKQQQQFQQAPPVVLMPQRRRGQIPVAVPVFPMKGRSRRNAAAAANAAGGASFRVSRSGAVQAIRPAAANRSVSRGAASAARGSRRVVSAAAGAPARSAKGRAGAAAGGKATGKGARQATAKGGKQATKKQGKAVMSVDDLNRDLDMHMKRDPKQGAKEVEAARLDAELEAYRLRRS